MTNCLSCVIQASIYLFSSAYSQAYAYQMQKWLLVTVFASSCLEINHIHKIVAQNSADESSNENVEVFFFILRNKWY